MYLNEVTAIYRFHENMETMSSPENLLKEYPIIKNKFINLDPNFAELHQDIIEYMDIRWIKYSSAKFNIFNGNIREARDLISQHKWFNYKLFLLFLATYFPQRLLNIIYHKIFFLKGKI